MSDRYFRLYSLPQNLYAEGSPVLILAGALLKDNQTGKVLVQLKFRNISNKEIKSIKIKVNAYDTASGLLKGVEGFSYLDLTVPANDEFGQSTPVVLPDATTRSFSVEILQAVFADKEVYTPAVVAEAQSAPQAVMDAVRQVEAEKAEAAAKEAQAAREARERTIANNTIFCKELRLYAIISIGLVVLSFVLSLVFALPGLKPYNYYTFSVFHINTAEKFLIALIAPCVCLIASFVSRKKAIWLKPTIVLSLIMMSLQIIAIVIYPSFRSLPLDIQYNLQPLYWEIPSLVNGHTMLYDLELLSFVFTQGFSRFPVVNLAVILGFLYHLCAIAPNILTSVGLLIYGKRIK